MIETIDKINHFKRLKHEHMWHYVHLIDQKEIIDRA